MGFNPFRAQARRTTDYVVVGVAMVVIVALVLWGLFGVSEHRFADSWGDHDTGALEVRHVQPYEAAKTYRCPGCDHEIPPGQGHEVVVPLDAPQDRRHWHTGCWRRESRRH